jgi:hypothetical protein
MVNNWVFVVTNSLLLLSALLGLGITLHNRRRSSGQAKSREIGNGV